MEGIHQRRPGGHKSRLLALNYVCELIVSRYPSMSEALHFLPGDPVPVPGRIICFPKRLDCKHEKSIAHSCFPAGALVSVAFLPYLFVENYVLSSLGSSLM